VRPCGTGVMEGRRSERTEQGPPQRSKPAGARNFMYYALDLMGPSREKRYAQGRVIIMLCCDDFLMGSHRGGLCATDADNLKGRLAPILEESSTVSAAGWRLCSDKFEVWPGTDNGSAWRRAPWRRRFVRSDYVHSDMYGRRVGTFRGGPLFMPFLHDTNRVYTRRCEKR
jgi:hypothetical protein